MRRELCRKDAESFVFSIKLLMVDEIHLIADETRGATLEATVVRMKSISTFQQQQVLCFVTMRKLKQAPIAAALQRAFAYCKVEPVILVLGVRVVIVELGELVQWQLQEYQSQSRSLPQAAKGEGEQHSLRIVAVSATVPNIRDVGEWIGAPASNICSFGAEFRPVPLTVQAISGIFISAGPRLMPAVFLNGSDHHALMFSGGSKFTNAFVFDKGLASRIPELLRQHSNGRPALVFCATRNSASAAATQLVRESASQLISGAQRQLLQLKENVDAINSCQDKCLQQLLMSGVGYHHGQLAQADRRVVEHLFVSRAILCLFATSTLAVGANLPAYLVIIKSTIQYRTVAGVAGWCEYDSHTIQQMAGRAGRPGFDTEGKCLILTQEHNVHKYRDIMNVQTLIESRLPSQLTEHLNSEIVLRSIKDIESMLCWASSTFFSVRAKKVPAQYFPQLKSAGGDAAAHVDRLIRDLMMQGYTALANASPPLCISTDEDGMSFKSTELGRVMAKYCVAFKTMETMARLLAAKTTMAEMIECLSEAEEFLDFKPRNDEKKILEDANKRNSAVRYKIQKKVNTGGWTTARKVALLLQIAMGGGTLENANLRNHMGQICDNAARVCEALVEFALSMQWFATAARAVKLCQGIKGRCWEDDTNGRVLQQLRGLGEAMAKKLASATPSVVNLNDLGTLSVGKLEVCPISTRLSSHSKPMAVAHLAADTCALRLYRVFWGDKWAPNF